MAILYRFNKPEYLFRPTQLLKRLVGNTHLDKILLPWGHTISVNPNEDIGKALNHLGVYELALSELLYRSLNEVDEFIDVGANIGYFSSLATHHPIFKGLVHAIEPHPILYKTLGQNLNNLNIKFYQKALSDKKIKASLFIPDNFHSNNGIASLEKPLNEDFEEIEVQLATLDDLMDTNKTYSIKIDTEGHEFKVLLGAKNLLSQKSFKYIFFEEFHHPSQAMSFKLLIDHGYEIKKIFRSILGPILMNPSEKTLYSWEPTTYLAYERDKCHIERLCRRGWKVLS